MEERVGDVDGLRAWLAVELSSLLGRDAGEVGLATPFFQLGVDSLVALKLISRLSQRLGRPLSPTLIWEHPTPAGLAAHLLGRDVEPKPGWDAPTQEPSEPVAIVGLACRFPSAPDAEGFWRVLQEGVDCVTDAPPERWATSPGAREGLRAYPGAFLDTVDRFDPGFFGISPREAGQLDPQQRLMLELSWEALEDAGIAPGTLRGSRTGVFTGLVWRDYADLQTLQGASASLHTCTGHAGSIVANRVSYVFGFEGPSLAIDTACSSSLVAILEACRSLRAGESTLALAGGVQLNLSPRTLQAVSAFGALAPDGRCKTFDARANGYGRGEGAGVVVLKPLSRALADGDSIYCVIRGGAVNNDGASNGLTAPSPKAQEQLLRAAYGTSGVDPARVRYVELHGTGTPLGDPIEARALGAVLGGATRSSGQPLHVGSVKTNIGHLEAAAGVAAVIKVALSIRKRRLPASLHFEQPNPHIPFDALNLRMQTELTAWPGDEGPVLAGISSFGFGGTNCHLVVEEHLSGPRRAAGPSSGALRPRPMLAGGPKKVAFLFAGAGSAWWGMGRELLAMQPVFRARFEACDAVYRGLGGDSLVEALLAPRHRSRFERGEVQLPVVLALQLSLAATWRDWGVEPSAVIGYSVGEWAAAHVAGILTLDEVFALARHYIQVQRSVTGGAGMGVVALPAAEVEARLSAGSGRIAIASVNSPRSTGIGGEPSALQDFAARLVAEGHFARTVEIDFYAHIPQVAPLAPLFLEGCPALRPLPGRIPMVSTVSGAFVDGVSLGPGYWTDNFQAPVRFADAVKTLLDSGHEVFLDVNPHPIHARAVEENIAAHAATATVVHGLQRGEPDLDGLHRALDVLASAGHAIRWERVFPEAPAPLATDVPAELFVLSARTEPALREQARRVAGQLRGAPTPSLGDLCATAALWRDHHAHRLTMVAQSRAALEDGLEAFGHGAPPKAFQSLGVVRQGEAPRVGFVFSGQGGFPLGESTRLLEEEPRFREMFERCDLAFRARTGGSLVEAMEVARDGAVPPRTEVEQPLLFAFQVSLAALWAAWGIRPDAVVGHSIGEVSAAHVAGALSLDEAMALVVSRSRLMGKTAGLGGMATVAASLERLSPLLAPHGDALSVAALNGPEDIVVSGARASLESLLDGLQAQGIRFRLLNVDHAFHSAQMDAHLAELDDCTRTLAPKALVTPLYSTVRGGRVLDSELDADHWRANIRQRVLFAPALQAMLADGCRVFVEVSPHPVLSQSLARTLEASGVEGTAALFSARRDRPPRVTMLAALGALHTLGREPSWKGVFPRGGRRVALPSYAWQRERYWFDVAPGAAPGTVHPLLGRAVEAPHGEARFESSLRADRVRLLADHRLYGTVVVAGASMVGMLLDAARGLWGPEGCRVQDVLFLSPIVMEDSEERVFQVSILAGGDFRLSTRPTSDDAESPRWTLHATGRLERGAEEPSSAEPLAGLEARFAPLASIERFYDGIDRQGLVLGRQFRWLEAVSRGEREALGRLRLPEAGDGAEDYRLHPGLIDSCFQVLGAVSGFSSIDGLAFVPIGIDRFVLHGAQRPRFCHLVLRSGTGAVDEASTVDLRLLDEAGGVVAEVRGLTIRRAPRDTVLRRDTGAAPLHFQVEWQPRPVAALASTSESHSWVLLADQGGFAESLARQLERHGARVEVVSTGLARPESHGEGLTYSRAHPDAGGEVPSAVLELRGARVEASSSDDLGRPGTRVEASSSGMDDERRLLERLDALGDSTQARVGVVDLRGLDTTAPLEGFERAVGLVKLLASCGGGTSPRLVLVTRGAQSTGADVGDIAIEQSPLWGLGHVVALEHPELRCVRIDLDPAGAADDAALLAQELSLSHDEDRIAFRSGRRLVARLMRARLPRTLRPPPLVADATYLITGGLGGLGLEVARWMVDRGARHLVLMGRRAPEPLAQARVDALRAAGATVTVGQGDVSSREEVARVLAACRASMPPLRGVVHAAGVLDDGLLVLQDTARMAHVLAPKIQGALNLHLETLESRLDFFVLFSSVSAVFGTTGQASYAAANAFLDALAHHRRANGLTATSINWGPWAEVGMAARLSADAGRSWSGFGLGMLAPAAALASLEGILGADLTQPVVAAASARPVREGLPPFFEVLAPRRAEPTRPAPPSVAFVGASPREARARLLSLLQTQAADVLGLSSSSPIDPRRPLQELGLDSLMALQLRNALSAALGRPLPVTLLFDHPSLEQLLDFLAREIPAADKVASEPAPRTVKARGAAVDGAEPIAVVGMSCRLPGGIRSPEDYWRLLADGVNAVREVPASRWTLDDWYDADPEAPGKTYSRHGGFLDDIDAFDASFFGISGAEARSMDPQQRMLLELSWEALERAGMAVERLKGTPTGVFLGICLSDYALLELNASDARGINAYSGSGGVLSVAAGRIAYALGLEGPTFAVDTACSSSLVATHLACQSLREGECDVALVGGSNLLLSPRMTVYFSKLKALSPDGACKAFDSSANGYVRGEGAGVVVLKRLSEALAAGDPVLAVIRGTAVNQDGRSNGLTAPSRPAQERVIESALRQGGVAPLDVGYVEAHGTGTSLGDPIEVQALAAVLGRGRPASSPLGIGSVKTNLGHLEGAAGIASLIKAILALGQAELPRSLHFKEPSPHIPWAELPVEVIAEHRAWRVPDGARRIAGVSSFGFSGTNAHVVLEEAPKREPRAEAPASLERPELLVLSARSAESLREAAGRLSATLTGEGGAAWRDLCYSTSCRRSHHEHRLAVVARSRSSAAEAMDAFLRGLSHPDVTSGYALPGAAPRVVFLFTGQGGQWSGAGRALLEEEPVFREALRSVDAVLMKLAGWSVIEELQREQPRFELAHISQPAHFALQAALVALLRSWGVEPDAVLGSSIGEVAAAHAAGVLSVEDAMRITLERSRILAAIAGTGAMSAVELSEAEATEAIANHGTRLSVAALNSPTSVLLSGDAEAMEEVLGALSARGVSCRRLGLDYASHSHAVEPHLEALRQALEGLAPRPESLPIFSSVSGLRAEGRDFDRDYWARNLRQPVRFAPAISALASEGHSLFVEIGPNAVLSRPVQQCFQQTGRSATVVSALRRGEAERHTLRALLGGLFVAGVSPAWEQLFPEGGALVALPSYPWRKERYWVASPSPAASRPASTQEALPLHGRRVRSPLAETLFEVELSVERMPLLREHLLHGAVVVAGAGHVSMVLSALQSLHGAAPIRLADIVFPRALVVEEGRSRPVSVVVGAEQSGRASFRIQSQEAGGEGDWVLHAEGKVLRAGAPRVDAAASLEQLRARCPKPLEVPRVYETMDAEGISLGRRFRWVEQLWQGEREALGCMRAPEPEDRQPATPLHPGLIDSLFHVLRGVPGIVRDDGVPLIPVGIEGVVFLSPPRGTLWAHAALRPDGGHGGETLSADFRLFGEDGATVAWIDGLVVKRAPREAFARDRVRALGQELFQVRWRPSPPVATPTRETGPWLLLTDRGGVGAAVADRLATEGSSCQVMASPEPTESEASLERRLEQALGAGTCRGVMYLAALDVEALEPGSEARVITEVLVGAVRVLQALTQLKRAVPPRLWLVTRGAQATDAGHALRLAQAPLWGLGATLRHEHPELRCTLVDLDPAPAADTVHSLCTELRLLDGEDRIAWRDGVRLAQRLQSLDVIPEPGPVPVVADATYLITGGLGGLGLRCARWLAKEGARHLALLGRNAPSEEARVVLQALAAEGVTVRVLAADVGERESLARALSELRADLPPLRGVIHAAGLLDDALLVRQERERIERVLRPKVAGALHLDQQTREDPLDFFVMFSSIAALLGGVGQANYSAANAFLDALAAERRARGLPACSLAWGPWAEVGLAAARADRGARLEALGVESLAPDEGVAILGRLLRGTTETHVGIARIDWAKWGQVYPSADHASLLTDFIRAQPRVSRTAAPEGLPPLQELVRMTPEARRARVEGSLRREVVSMLALPGDLADGRLPLVRFGFDSLMGMKLKARLELALGLSVPAVKLLSGLSFDDLVTLVLESLDAVPPPPEAALDDPMEEFQF
ncbi:SDR family NAD(P)-dependent oxidoreductase [Myxococcus sp. K38C18041901]|uniref:type I polyketide synthase n=1 Tax=Myxococcus guangdongensis TaxID=2906760 RepID=UPI0020A83533|nr:type I polyketide synthase [Myxococcus guangdongensis]MCP3063711.1 SDR family NAD(P)-dependent oxidoreductase [Myxococcus guangdongensis]